MLIFSLDILVLRIDEFEMSRIEMNQNVSSISFLREAFNIKDDTICINYANILSNTKEIVDRCGKSLPNNLKIVFFWHNKPLFQPFFDDFSNLKKRHAFISRGQLKQNRLKKLRFNSYLLEIVVL